MSTEASFPVSATSQGEEKRNVPPDEGGGEEGEEGRGEKNELMFGANSVDSIGSLREMCLSLQEFINPFKGDAAVAQLKDIEDTIQSTLVRLEEFCAFVQAMRTSSTQASQVILPKFVALAAQVEQLFNRVDLLQAYLNATDSSVSALEQKLSQAEAELKGQKSVTSFFKSFVSRVSSPQGEPTAAFSDDTDPADPTSGGGRAVDFSRYVVRASSYFSCEGSDDEEGEERDGSGDRRDSIDLP